MVKSKKQKAKEKKRKQRTSLKEADIDVVRGKDKRARSKSRERKCYTTEGRAQHLAQKREHNQHRASKKAASEEASEADRLSNLKIVSVPIVKERVPGSRPAVSADLTPMKRESSDELNGRSVENLKSDGVDGNLCDLGASLAQVSLNDPNALGLDSWIHVDKSQIPVYLELKNWRIHPKKPLPPSGESLFDLRLKSSRNDACPTLTGQINQRYGRIVPKFNMEIYRLCSDFKQGHANTVALHPLPREEIKIKWGTELELNSNTILLIGKPTPMAKIENWHVGSGGIVCGAGGGRTWTSIGGKVYNDTELLDGESICFKTMWPIKIGYGLVDRWHDIAIEVESGDIVMSEDFIGYRLGTKKPVQDWQEYSPQRPRTNLSRNFTSDLKRIV